MKCSKKKSIMDTLVDNMVYADSLIPFEKNGLWGYKDTAGKIVIKPAYDAAFFFSDGLAPVIKQGQWQEINTYGRPVPPGPTFNEGLEPVKYRDLFGYINQSGSLVIPPLFKEAYGFFEGLARVRIDIWYVFTDDKGSFIRKPTNAFKNMQKYHDAGPGFQLCKNGVVIKERFGFIDRNGDFAVPPVFVDAEDFNEGAAVVRAETGYGYVDTKGKFLCKPEFYLAHDFKEGRGHVLFSESEHGYLNNAGKIISRGFTEATDFSEDLAAVKKDNWYLFINKRMEVEIEMQFEDTPGFSEGLAPVKINGRWGYINKKGQITIAPQYEMATGFIEGIASVRSRGKMIKINRQGKQIS